MDRDIYHALFVDDDKEFLSSMKMSMTANLNEFSEDVDVEPHFLNSPHEAIGLATELTEEDEDIAVIVSDQQMPDLTGIELLEKLKILTPDSTKVLLTGYASLDSAKYAINNRILDQYVSKPIEDYDNFRLIIKGAVQTARLRVEKEKAEQEVERYVKQLEENNRTIRSMHIAAEKIAYFAQGFKKLDFDEVISLIMTRIPEVFNAKCASLFIVDEKKDQLQMLRSTHFQKRYIRPLNDNASTPMLAALQENKVIVIPETNASTYDFLGKRNLGPSCVIIPFIITDESHSIIPLGDMKGIRGVLNLGDVGDIDKLDVVQYAATLVQNILGINILNAKLYQRTHDLALYDGLTGLYNKHVFTEFLRKECEGVDRSYLPVQLAIFDLDDFKVVNDTHGHLVGDAVLSKVGRILRNASRKGDVIGRFGGEEFAWLLAHGNRSNANALERLRQDIEQQEFSKKIRITTSVGVAQYLIGSGDSMERLIERADQALYRAKASGKNRIEVASDDEDE